MIGVSRGLVADVASVAFVAWFASRHELALREPRTVWIVVHADSSSQIDLGALSFRPKSSVVRARRVDDGDVLLGCDVPAGRTGTVHLEAPGACPVDVALDGVRRADPPRRIVMTPWMDLGEERPQVGFDEVLEVRATPGCPQAAAGRIVWRQTEGPPLTDVSTEDRGFVLRARTLPLSRTKPGPLPWGIVPFSPRTRGAYAFEAAWEGPSEGAGPTVHATLRFASVARAPGVSAVSVGQRLVLGGSGWHVRDHPRQATATVVAAGEHTTFAPDAAGHWVLEDGAERRLTINAGRFDTTPLDCGRADCHAAEAAAAADSPMTQVLARGVEGALGAAYEPRCALACHALGQAGLHDGGFVDVAHTLSYVLPAQPRAGLWNAMPRELRRLGGVGCTACHGPAAIPEKDARWAVLRADVCATCHDMPPRYGHVEAWGRSRMARSDASNDDERQNEVCSGCHTTRGFLHALGVPRTDPETARGAPPMGITCAACHAPHGAHEGAALVRAVDSPDGAAKAVVLGSTPAPRSAFGSLVAIDPTSRVCMACHSPLGVSPAATSPARVPFASAAALWLGSGRAGKAEGPAPHAAVGRCTGCHSGRGTGRGESHSFEVDADRCRRCHAAASPPVERPDAQGQLVRDRARALWARLFALGAVSTHAPEGGPPMHASSRTLATSRGTEDRPMSEAESAAWDVRLVLEDPAAGVHNAPFARALLDGAQQIIQHLERRR